MPVLGSDLMLPYEGQTIYLILVQIEKEKPPSLNATQTPI
jgi:hypothetical protein